MLDVGRAPERLAGLTVFFDHADPRLRYVVAETPGLVADPEPRLSLVLFRGEAGSGGLLQFESRLAPSEEQLAALEEELSRTGQAPILARPDWRSGTTRVAGWLETDELAPLSLSVGIPSLVGDPVALIAARLDAPGAALADAALRGNALPTALIFELETLGLSGPLGITAEADLQAMHDRLTAEGALNTPYGRARIAKTWESFESDNLIRIRVVDESGDVEGSRAEAMRRVGQDLIAKMFSPFPSPELPPQLDDESVAQVELSFRLTMRREELETTSRWSFVERRAVSVKHYAAASLIGLLGERSADDHIKTIDLAIDTREFVVRLEPELAALGLGAVEVDLRSGSEGEPDHTVVLSDELNSERLDITGSEELIYRVRARFAPERTRAQDRESDWMEVSGDFVLVSARRLFPPREVTVVAGRVEFDWLDHVEVAVEAPEEPLRSLVLSSDVRSASAYFPAAGDGEVSVTAHWRGLPGEPTRTDPPRPVPSEILVLDSPFGDSIEVLVIPLPLPGLLSTTVELRTAHDGFVHSKTATWDAPDRTPQRVGLRRLTDSPRSYEYRVTLVREDGTQDASSWIETDDVALVVGSDVPTRVHAVEVVALGGGPAGRGSFAIELALEAGEHRTRDLLEGERDRAELVLVAPESAPEPILIARETLGDFQVRETRWESPDSLTVLPFPSPNIN